MAPKNPTKHQDQNVDIALIQQDIQYIKDTQSQIRTELHDFRAFFVTKDQHIAALQQRDDAIQALLVRIQNVEKGNDVRDEKFTFYVRAFIVAIFTTVLGVAAAIYQAHLGQK